MRIKTTLTVISLMASLTPSISAADITVKDIEPYMTPANAINQPSQMIYSNDGKTYYDLMDGGKKIIRRDIKSGQEIETVLDVSTTRENQVKAISSYILSPDESHILIYEQSIPIYRRTYKAKYYVFEVRHNVLRPLSEINPYQQSPLWSPDGRMIAYVADNNIYLRKLDYNVDLAVTTDGEYNKVINGIPDWVYEEEFSTNCSMSWAPDNATLCYLRYDEEQVPRYSFTMYQGTCDPMDQYALYPGQYTYKYPVAGEKNSKVTLHSYDIDNRKTKDITFEDPRIEYIPRIHYTSSPDRLIVTTLNRDQNRIEMYAVNPKSTVAKSIYVDEVTDGWVDPSAWEMVRYYNDFFIISSERSGFNHLYQYSYTGAQMRQLTSGDYDVTAFYGYDSLKGYFYFQSTAAGAINRVVTRIDAKGKLSTIGSESGTTSLTFSPDMAYYTMAYSDANTPTSYTLYTSQGKEVRTIADNSDYFNRYPTLPKKEFFTFNSDGNELNGYIIRPVNFDQSRRYPVIMSQYSGPGSQEVLNSWSNGWENFFTTQGYIIMCVDGRGTGGRGKAFKDCTYRNLGKYETIDQINAAKYAASLPYVDSNRIGIYGWSFGGYESIMAASLHNYAAAVAVAPVTSWRYYDSIYTERYMLTPRQNEDGYTEGSPITYVDRITTPLLIMHGTADDNVHLMNTMQYVSALQNQGKTCDMFLFPNKNHSIYGCNARSVVYLKMLQFFNYKMK